MQTLRFVDRVRLRTYRGWRIDFGIVIPTEDGLTFVDVDGDRVSLSASQLLSVTRGKRTLQHCDPETAAVCELIDPDGVVGDYGSWTEGLEALDEQSAFGWSPDCVEGDRGVCETHRERCTEAGPEW